MNSLSLEWKEHFRSRGLSADIIREYEPYISELSANGAPVIFEFEHLSKLIGVDQCQLRKMVNSPSSFYHTFKIKKRSGGSRTIKAPYPSLLMCQDWIYKNILLNQSVHEAAHGYIPNRSIFSNASCHLNNKCLLKMDLKDFFPSIKINWVINFFSKLGYAKNVSFYLAALCCESGGLVQGASTSPYLTNILLISLDQRLSKLSEEFNLNYTRYADDLTFSGNYIPHKIIDIVESIVTSFGLLVNQEKTRLQLGANQRIVTGLSVAGTELKVPRNFKRQLKLELHYISKYGFNSHTSRMKIRNPFYIESLIGKLNFLLQAEPHNQFAKEAITIITKNQ